MTNKISPDIFTEDNKKQIKLIRVSRSDIDKAGEKFGQPYLDAVWASRIKHRDTNTHFYFEESEYLVLDNMFLPRPEQTPIQKIMSNVVALSKAPISYLRSVHSRSLMTTKRVDKAYKEMRVLACHGDGDKQAPCERRRYSERQQFHFCNGCSCGARAGARLSAVGSTLDNPITDKEADYLKLDYPYLECPLKKLGFSNYDPEYKSKESAVRKPV